MGFTIKLGMMGVSPFWYEAVSIMNYQPSEFQRRQGDRFATDHSQWEYHSRIIFAGALACWERHFAAHQNLLQKTGSFQDLNLIVPALFLAATGVETLLEAMAIQGDPALAVSGEQPFYTHKLHDIARKYIRGRLSDEDYLLLERLSSLIEWAGRYPIPKWNAEKHRRNYDVPARVVDGQEFINARDVPGSFTPDTWQEACALIEKLQSTYAAARDKSNLPPA